MSKRLNDRQRYSATEVALTLRLAKRDCDDEPTMFLQLKSHKVYDLKAYLQFKDWPATGHKDVLITRIINLHGSPCHTISDSVLFQASDSESAPVPKRLKRWHSDLELESQSKSGEPLSHTGCSCGLCPLRVPASASPSRSRCVRCVSKSLKENAVRFHGPVILGTLPANLAFGNTPCGNVSHLLGTQYRVVTLTDYVTHLPVQYRNV
jgi:hypothetical protein